MARTSWLVALFALSLSSGALFAARAGAQATAEVPPAPGASGLAAPMQPAPDQAAPVQAAPVQAVPAQPAPVQVGPAQSASPYGYSQPTQPYGTQPYVAQPVAAQPFPGQFEAPRRRGHRLEDSAATGEIVDLMIVTGGYGIMFGNAIIDWAPDGTSGVASHFTATVLGAALSLTGLLAADAPRGVPTMMAIGLRYGMLLSLFGYGAFAGDNFRSEPLLAAMTLGGLVGYGVGAGIGFGGRPHMSRSRFVEAGGLWGAGLAALLAGAVCAERAAGGMSCGTNASGMFGALLAGTSTGLLVHTLIASLNPVAAGRGWLLNAAFGAGAGLGAFFTWGLSNGTAGGEYIMSIASAIGVIGLVVMFIVTDGIQDAGWDEGVEETLSRVQIGIGPTQGGGMGTLSVQF